MGEVERAAPSKEEALRQLPPDELLEEGPLQGPPPQSRREARELALKTLYSLEIEGSNWEKTLKTFIPDDGNKYANFARELCEKIRSGAEEIDRQITSRSEKWDFDRIALIDKIILRMAIAEILFFSDIPPKVTINEAIEIAKRYSTENSSRFVNGILDAVFNDLQKSIVKDTIKPRKRKNHHPKLKG